MQLGVAKKQYMLRPKPSSIIKKKKNNYMEIFRAYDDK